MTPPTASSRPGDEVLWLDRPGARAEIAKRTDDLAMRRHLEGIDADGVTVIRGAIDDL